MAVCDELRPPGELPATQSVIFTARTLTKVYGSGEAQVHALRGIDLELFESEFVPFIADAEGRADAGDVSFVPAPPNLAVSRP